MIFRGSDGGTERKREGMRGRRGEISIIDLPYQLITPLYFQLTDSELFLFDFELPPHFTYLPASFTF